MASIHEVIRTRIDIPAAYAAADAEFSPLYNRAVGWRRGERTTLAVIDEGTHDDGAGGYLSSHLQARVDTTGAEFKPRNISHGSKVAGLAVYGHPKLKYVDLRVRTQAARGAFGARTAEEECPRVAKAIEDGVAAGASVILMALATENKKRVYIESGIERAIDENPTVLFVFGAGNNGRDVDSYDVCPAGLGPKENMIIVGGCGPGGEVTVTSDGGDQMNFGYGDHSVDVASFADNLALYDPGFQYAWDLPMPYLATDTGVSFAIPQVANVAAKMWLLNKNLTPKQIKDIVVGTATDCAKLAGKNRAHGILNPAACYNEVM